MTDDSYITTSKNGATGFIGPDATELFRVTCLRSGLRMLKVGILPTRGMTKTKALLMCKRYTGKNYRRTDAGIDEAIGDLTVWIATMQSGLRVEVRP